VVLWGLPADGLDSYVIQFMMMPILIRDYWISIFLGNSLYLIAFSFYCIITFLGYNGTCDVPEELFPVADDEQYFLSFTTQKFSYFLW
jgi:hypothetical protein